MLAPYTLVFSLLSLSHLALGGSVQKSGLIVPSEKQGYQGRVKTIFTDSYGAYKKFAFGHDDVAPINKTFSDGRNGWGATIVDAMTTMKIMGLEDLFTEAVNFASNIDFSQSKTPDTVSVFESTIRYVGALLSAYELSDQLSGQKYPQLVTKAKELADKLAFSWVGTSNIPFGHIDFSTNTPQKQTTNIAEAGTLTLEWATLSKLTGNDRYRQLAEKSVRHIAEGGAPLPGLPGQGIDPASGLPVGKYVTWGGGSDSYFEYLIKYARLNNTMDPIFADSWRTGVDSSIHTLLKTSVPGSHAYLADFDDDGKIRHVSSHLACFHGGNWLFGGRLLDNQTIVDIGLQLIDSCWNTYESTSTGIGPEQFAFVSLDGGYTGGNPLLSESQISFHAQHGFYITSADYILRPEVLESNFYAWRVTGDTKYLDRAAAAVTSFEKYLKVQETGGYAGLYDVNNVNSQRVDDTESFWYAEVLKYLYLTFDDPSHIHLDEYVFNTEAHPFKVPAVPADHKFGTGIILQQAKPSTTASGDLPDVSKIPQASSLGLIGFVMEYVISPS